GNVLSPAAVLIESGKIKEVGAPSRVQADAPAGVKTIDLGSATFLPGLLLAIVESPSKRVLMGAQAAREDLESGITTIRNLGHSDIDGDNELRDDFKAESVVGPCIMAFGRTLNTGISIV